MRDLSLFKRIGGLRATQELADRFYDIMQSEDFAQPILQLHPKNLKRSRSKLYRFLSEWFGGPSLFGKHQVNCKWLHLRHQHLPIGDVETEQWLRCMQKALKQMQFAPQIQEECMHKFRAAAKSIQNQ